MQFTTSVAEQLQVVEELRKDVEAVAKKYAVTPEGQLARKIRYQHFKTCLQGDQAACSEGYVDVKTKVAF